jgi:EAL domain-containing protein (putative c-di-GMP-specific phosphodiesterase class I)
VRAADTLARLGGDEFAILLEDAASDGEVVEVADRALAALRQPFAVEGVEVFVRASIGISAAGASADDVLRDADAAMYHAKKRGGGRAEKFEPGLHTAALERLALITDLRRALDRDELEVHYQPIIDLHTQQIRGVEALARWRHPERGLVPPLTFIPLAEETGLIGEVGLWILRQACQQVRAWQDAQAPDAEPLNLSVNLSVRQVQDPRLAEQIADVLSAVGLAASTLTLEITEGLLLHDDGTIQARLRALKDLGVNLALDDFGTGYSSLGYLQRFPIDVLKIDKSFVDQVTVGAEASALVGTIVSLSDTLQMRTVAEGIEQPEQAERLRSLGCGGGQGYYFARPLTAAGLSDVLRAAAHPTPVARAA